MLFEHQVLHSLHDKLGAGVHHSGKQPVEEEEVGGGGSRGGDTEEEEEDRVSLVVSTQSK